MSDNAKMQSGDSAAGSASDRGLWDWLFHRSPRVARLLFGGYALLVVSALVLAWHISIALLTLTAIIVVVLSVVISLLTGVISRRQTSLAATAILWSVVALVVALMGLFVSSAFLGVPAAGVLLIARIANAPELLIHDPSHFVEVNGGVWPEDASAPLDVRGTTVDRIKALGERPSLIIRSNRPVGGGHIAVDVLDLEGESIVTNGASLVIEALKVRSLGGVIRAFPGGSKAMEGHGVAGGSVTLIVHDRIVGSLVVDLIGQAGADGRVGAPGHNGAQGAQGENAASGLFDCRHGPGRGDGPSSRGSRSCGQRGYIGRDGRQWRAWRPWRYRRPRWPWRNL